MSFTTLTIYALCGLRLTCDAFVAFRRVGDNGFSDRQHGVLNHERILVLNALKDDAPDDSNEKKSQKETEGDTVKFRYSDMSFDKAVRVAKAQAEVDSLLNGPDAPFDFESEMKKVNSVSPGLGPEEQVIEDKVMQVEAELYAAIEKQDYGLAATKKEEVGRLHIDDCGSVLQVNCQFYQAFSEKDYDKMEKLWLKDNSILCIHPSNAPLVGNQNVMSSWKSMFESSNGSFQKNWMEPSQVRLVVKGATAIVTCDEEVFARQFVRGKKRQTELVNKLCATNIFRKVSGKWYMVYHHASWHHESDAAKQALNQKPSSEAPPPDKTGRPNVKIVRLGADPKDGDAISPESLFGLPGLGPLLGGSSPDEDKSKPVKRVVMGSLSDLLNGGLGDIISGDNENDENDGTVIRFSSSSSNDDGDENSQNDEEESITFQDWFDSKQQIEAKSGKTSSTKGTNNSSAPKDALRQNCISALRNLCKQGSISPKQKRLLLTDIISCSAKGEFSMVEVAYELLCGEGEDKDAAEEEFADQCRVFAHSLDDTPGAHY